MATGVMVGIDYDVVIHSETGKRAKALSGQDPTFNAVLSRLLDELYAVQGAETVTLVMSVVRERRSE